MVTLILIILGAFIGWFISGPRYNKPADIIMGILGALSSSSIINSFDISIFIDTTIAFLATAIGVVTIIHISRFLQKFPYN